MSTLTETVLALLADGVPRNAAEIYAATNEFNDAEHCARTLAGMATGSAARLQRELRPNPKAGQKGQRSDVYYYWINADQAGAPVRKTPPRPAPELAPSTMSDLAHSLQDRLDGIAHALRGSGLPGLAKITGQDDLQMAVAALTGAYQMALADVARLERAPTSAARDGEPIGYAVMTDDAMLRPSIDAARTACEEIMAENGDISTAHVVAVLATAQRTITWRPQ